MAKKVYVLNNGERQELCSYPNTKDNDISAKLIAEAISTRFKNKLPLMDYPIAKKIVSNGEANFHEYKFIVE